MSTRCFSIACFALALMVLSMLSGCSGGFTGAAKERWDADQAVLRRAEKAMQARDFRTSIAAYQELWMRATQPTPPEGSLDTYFILTGMSKLARTWTPAIEDMKAWEPPLGTLIKEGRASRSQAQAWTDLVDFARLDERVIAMTEYLRSHPEARKALNLESHDRTILMGRLRNQQHDDLAAVFAPSPGAAIISGLADTAGGAVGVVAAPFLHPFIAPR